MRNLLIGLVASLFVSSAFAQPVHQATPFDVLLKQYRDAHPGEMSHEGHDMGAMDMSQSSTSVAPALDPASEVAAAATKTFNVTAHQFAFTISPSPLVVNQGDTVTLNITSSDVTHGFFLESYATNNNAGFVLQKGKTTTVTFVANSPGTFTYFCTVSSCGAGHANMSGTMTVTAVQQTPAPAIVSFSPESGPTTGGTNVVISGSGFSAGATVLFGSTAAASVTVNDANTISATSPAHPAGNVPITVTNTDGQNAASSGQFTYLTPPPQLSISAVSPANGSTSGGTAVTITGSGFSGSNVSVTFGGAAATNLVVTASSLSVVTPAHAGGRVDVVVTVGTASATAAGAFTFEPPAPRRRSAKHG